MPYAVNMPLRHARLPKSLAGGLLGLLVGLPAAWAQPSAIHVQPLEPTINDMLTIDVDFTSSCFTGRGRTTVSGKAITIEVFEACACPAVFPPPPVSLSTTVPPLLSGHYTVEASRTPDPHADECFFPDQILASLELDVQWVKTQLRVDPPFPDAHDDVVLTLRSQCPMGIDAPSIYRHQVLIRAFDTGVLAPCTQDLSWESEAHLGQLEPGRYTVVWNYDNGSGAQTAVTSRTFVVRAADK